MLRIIACMSALTCLIAVTMCDAANAQSREMVIRTDARGQKVAVPKPRTFEGCVRGGMRMGYPRVGPGGESDRRGAVGYCHSLGL